MNKLYSKKAIMIFLFACILIVLYIIGTKMMFSTKKDMVAYAMNNDLNSHTLVYAKTVGSNITRINDVKNNIDNNDNCYNKDNSYNNENSNNIYNNEDYEMLHEEIINEQYIETMAAGTVKIQKPELIVNGLKTTFRKKINISNAEKKILYRIVEAEAGGEDISGRMLVANVIINRVKSSHYPDNIKDVVFARSGRTYQFSPIKDGRYYSVKISAGTKKAVKRALSGEDNSSGAEYFICRRLAGSKNIRWFDNCLTYLFEHGCHEFFQDR